MNLFINLKILFNNSTRTKQNINSLNLIGGTINLCLLVLYLFFIYIGSRNKQ